MLLLKKEKKKKKKKKKKKETYEIIDKEDADYSIVCATAADNNNTS